MGTDAFFWRLRFINEYFTWRSFSLEPEWWKDHFFFTNYTGKSFIRKWIPVNGSLFIDVDYSIAWLKFNSYRNWSWNIHWIECITILLIFFVIFRIRNSWIETCTKFVEIADFNFGFYRWQTFFALSYFMGTPSSRTFVAFDVLIINSISNPCLLHWTNLLPVLSKGKLCELNWRTAFALRVLLS